jgi:hypothetical protein
MAVQINEFLKGDNRDIDVLKLSNDTARRMKNVRLLDVDGKGLVVTNIGGNEYRFSLSKGFIPIGKCEYNGIGYIASVNPDTGLGEIGCYPAPAALVNQNITLTGFGATKSYAPLFNFTGGNPSRDPASLNQPFTTSLFNFDCNYQIDMFARQDYDGSVNLYLGSGNNPLRVINSGFDKSGALNSLARRYWDNSFPNVVNMLHESENHIDVQFNGLGNSGSTKAGNWIFFARYATESFDRTSFFTETNAIQITAGLYANEGIGHHGLLGGRITDKSIRLTFTNLDTTYSYLELGYIYSFNDTQEFGIIDKFYHIDPNITTLDIEITGFEGMFNIGFEELIKTKPKYDGAITHTQLENRYFAADLFDTTQYDDDSANAILDFSQKIRPKYDDSKLLPHISGGLFRGIYNNEMNAYNYTGYFRGEAYAYGIVCVLKNGRETQAFPIEGIDDYSGSVGPSNINGIYRFPNINISPTVVGNDVRIMGVKFDITSAISSIPQYILDNVSGFYFVRAKRNETLLYQGLTTPCYNAATGLDIRGIWFLLPDFPQTLRRNENIVPMFEREGDDDNGAQFPYIHRIDYSALFDNEFTFVSWHKKLNKRVADRFGFYSPDHFFNKTLDISKGFIQPFAKVDFTILNESGASKPDYYYNDDVYTFSTYSKNLTDISNIKEWEPANNNGFSSFFDEGARTDFNSNFYFFAENLLGKKYIEVRNHAMAWNSYIGVRSSEDLRYSLSNVYKTNVDPSVFDISDLYDLKATNYYKISKFFRISDVVANPSIINNTVFYRGDCFLQRTWLKQLFNPKYGVGVKDDGGGLLDVDWPGPLETIIGERLFTFGTSFSIITENKINTEMRIQNVVNKFFPGSGANIYDFAVKNIEKESQDLNRGYNEILSVKFYGGFDREIPFVAEKKPAGIMYSNKHVLGSFVDGYRMIDLNAINDYDFRLGKIVRLTVLNNLLISIQEFGLNRHFVNEKAILNNGVSAGELLLGTGDILDKKHLNMSDFVGSQHMWSVISTDKSILGVDYNKRKIWRIIQEQGNLSVEMTSDNYGYRSELHSLCEINSSDSDITELLADNPVCTAGVVAHYDRKHNDVYFTWINGNPLLPSDCDISRNGKTIVFNEWLNAFHGERTATSPMSLTINEDFFLFNPNIFPSMNPTPSNLADAWIQDIKISGGVENATVFFGKAEPDISYVEFIVKEPADLSKVFDNMHISSSPDDLYKAVYETQHQFSEHFPWRVGDEANFWRDPIYQENLWRIPIIRTQQLHEPVNNIYGVDSRLRGRWIKIRLEYKTRNNIFIKSVLTVFRESKH